MTPYWWSEPFSQVDQPSLPPQAVILAMIESTWTQDLSVPHATVVCVSGSAQCAILVGKAPNPIDATGVG